MHSRPRGFTLVEVLVALMILAVLSTMAWQGIDGMARARASSQARMEQTLRLSTVVAQWEQDLAAIYDTPVVPPLDFDGSTVRMARITDSGVQVVAWTLRGTKLQRWSSPAGTRAGALQDSWMNSQQLLGNEAGQITLLEDVSSMHLEFYRNNAWTNAQSEGDKDAGGTREVLPGAVRLVLGTPRGTIRRDVLLEPRFP